MRRLSIPFTPPSYDRAIERLTLSTPRACQLMYYVYIRVVILGVFSRHSSQYRGHHGSVAVFYCAIERIALDAIDAKRNNRYSVTSFLTTPLAHQLMYYLYIRVAVQGAFPCHSSQYCCHHREVLVNCVRLCLHTKMSDITGANDKFFHIVMLSLSKHPAARRNLLFAR